MTASIAARGEGQGVDGVDFGAEMDEVVVAAGPGGDVAEDQAEGGADER